MHVSAPNFDICVTLSVGIKHATNCSNAQASGKRTQACPTSVGIGWKKKMCKTLAVIHLDQLPLSSLVLFIHFIIHMTEEKHRWTNADLSVLAVFPQLGCLARMQAHLVSAVSTGMGKVPHRPGSPTPPFFLPPRFHTPFSPFEEFVFQTGSKHTCTHDHRWSPRCRRCDGDAAARSTV